VIIKKMTVATLHRRALPPIRSRGAVVISDVIGMTFAVGRRNASPAKIPQTTVANSVSTATAKLHCSRVQFVGFTPVRLSALSKPDPSGKSRPAIATIDAGLEASFSATRQSPRRAGSRICRAVVRPRRTRPYWPRPSRRPRAPLARAENTFITTCTRRRGVAGDEPGGSPEISKIGSRTDVRCSKGRGTPEARCTFSLCDATFFGRPSNLLTSLA
jgi:hypothetical protein